MSENYFYSSLTAEQIESRLIGGVLFNEDMELTDSEKARARLNIGAGQEDVGIIIKGFYATLEALEQYVPIGNEGDAYGVGTEPDFNIYIWDSVHGDWVDNGAVRAGNLIVDSDTSTNSTWSSSKISTELDGKMDATADAGMLKSTGSAVQVATKGTDYGALSFTVTLASNSWSSNAQTVSNANFLASGYVYIVSPASTSFAAYGEAQIYADDVSTDGSMVFHCDGVPSSDLTVNIARVVSA